MHTQAGIQSVDLTGPRFRGSDGFGLVRLRSTRCEPPPGNFLQHFPTRK